VARIGEGADLLKCSFCARAKKQVKKLIAGQACTYAMSASICATRSSRRSWPSPPRSKWDSLPKPREIYEFLDSYVIGQEKAKKACRSPSTHHYKRIQSGG